MSTNNNDYSHLKELAKSNYEIADGESDIRSWVVKNENGNILGEVDEIIFDTTARKAVYIVLNLNRNELNLKERKVLLPLEYADVNVAYKNVIYKGLMPNEIAVLPTYETGKISRNSIDLTTSTFLSATNNNFSANIKPETVSQNRSEEKDNFRDKVQNSNADFSARDNTRAHFTERQSFEDRNKQLNTSALAQNPPKPYTVVAVFEQSGQVHTAIEHLTIKGFDKDDITVSTRKTDINHHRSNTEENGITHFFKSLFDNDDEVKRYSNSTEKSSVVSVDVSSAGKAEEVADILDNLGSIDIKDSEQSGNSTKDNHSGNTRIFKRNINN
ncbi:MAG: PRC-barrel domain-containing protein [Flavobacterium sp.]|nr:PRC-barrel domain-containing protein [Pedobacter sp.]